MSGGAQPPRILVVDDDPVIRQLVARTLGDEGYGVDVASDGQDALDYLGAYPMPALILLDLMLPRLDGHAFAQAMRTLYEDAAPIIVFSASVRSNGAAAGIGAVGLIPKPFDLDALVATVAGVVGTADAMSGAV